MFFCILDDCCALMTDETIINKDKAVSFISEFIFSVS